MKFKVGDHVQIKKDSYSNYRGHKGIIIQVEDSFNSIIPYEIRIIDIESKPQEWFDDYEITLINQKLKKFLEEFNKCKKSVND